MWSMGVILYVMYVSHAIASQLAALSSFLARLSGSPPFDDSKPLNIFEQIKKAQYDFELGVWSDVSRAGAFPSPAMAQLTVAPLQPSTSSATC